MLTQEFAFPFLSASMPLLPAAFCMISFNHPIVGYWLWLLHLICSSLPIWNKAKSNWCNKSNWVKAVGVVPHSCLAVSNEQTVVLHAPICQVCEGRVGTGTRVLKKSQRRTQSRALESCITGWADDEALRGCLSHHRTHCFLAPLLSLPSIPPL